MSIDPFTLIAQLVNFLILVLLLKRFLYNPIVRTMDEREHKIASQLEEARLKEEEATREARVCADERRRLEDRRGEMLSEARREAEQWRRDLAARAHEEIEASKRRWGRAIEREKQTFLRELRQRTGEEVYAISRRALKELAGAELEDRMIDAFIVKLEQMDAEERAEIATAARRSPHGAIIYSTFAIDQDTRARLDAVVRETISWDIAIGFKLSSELICGIELRAGGRKAAWSLDSYLSDLDEAMELALSESGYGET